MAEPQPSNIHEGATEETPVAPTSAEDRKTQAALSSLETRGEDDDASSKKDVDTEALGKAMKNLKVKEGDEVGKTLGDSRKFKVDATSVTLLVCSRQLSYCLTTNLLS